jgi:hypothetical protein
MTMPGHKIVLPWIIPCAGASVASDIAVMPLSLSVFRSPAGKGHCR